MHDPALILHSYISLACQDIVYQATNSLEKDSHDRPIIPVVIAKSGKLPLDQPFVVEKAGVV